MFIVDKFRWGRLSLWFLRNLSTDRGTNADWTGCIYCSSPKLAVSLDHWSMTNSRSQSQPKPLVWLGHRINLIYFLETIFFNRKADLIHTFLLSNFLWNSHIMRRSNNFLYHNKVLSLVWCRARSETKVEEGSHIARKKFID